MARLPLVLWVLLSVALAGCSLPAAAPPPALGTSNGRPGTGSPAATSETGRAAATNLTPTPGAGSPPATAAPFAGTTPAGMASASAPVATATAGASQVEATPGPAAVATPGAASQPANAQPAVAPDSVGLQLVAQGFASPVALVPVPDSSRRLFVVDQVGLIRVIGQDGQLKPDPFLDLRAQLVRLTPNYDERGLLGLAFHPGYSSNGRFFVFYTAPLRQGAPGGWNSTMRLSEFKVSGDNPDHADLASERVIMEVDEPQANHKGGTVIFGPDGYLYISLGDGGGANDTDLGHNPEIGNGQDRSTRLGKILRIDVSNQNGSYGIPNDNPFKDGPVPEIYAYGLRNPYRISFDMGGSHELYAADAGQNLFEEVDLIARGGNYGWHIKEGSHCFDPQDASNPPASCQARGPDGSNLIDPVIEYTHPDVGIVVVGGYVYRGKALPGLVGQYIFGDWSTSFGSPDGTLLAATPAGQGVWPYQKLAISTSAGGRIDHFVLGLGQDSDGEIYVLTSDRAGPTGGTGQIYKIVPGA